MADEVEDESDSVVDSWEDFEQNPEVLEEQLRKMSMREDPQILKQSPREILITSSDSQHTGFPMNQEPKIMILRRPDNNLPNGNASKFKQTPKSLEQRQVEYAQARLRILGNAGAASEETNFTSLQSQEDENSTLKNSTSADEEAENSTSISNFYINKNGQKKPIAVVKPSIMNVNIIRKPNGTIGQDHFENRNINHKST